MPRVPSERRPSLAQQLVLDLSQRILAGEFPPGSKLPTEQVFTEERGVSRTVVREAMSRLQAAGLVETRRGIGTFVVDTQSPGEAPHDAAEKGSACDAVAITELRLSLEVEAAAIAAQRATAEQLLAMRVALDDAGTREANTEEAVRIDFAFDLQIALCTGNSFFIDAISHLGNSLMADARQAIPALHEPQRQLWLREREQIHASIARKDADGARAAMRLHLVNCLTRTQRAAVVAE